MLYEMKNPTASAAGSLQDTNVLHPNTAQKLGRSQATNLLINNRRESSIPLSYHDRQKTLTMQAFDEYQTREFFLLNQLTRMLKEHGVDDPVQYCHTPNEHNPNFLQRCGKSYCPACSQRKHRLKDSLYALMDNELLNNIGLCTCMATIVFQDQKSENILRFYTKLQNNFASLSRSRVFRKVSKGFIRAMELSMSSLGLYHVHMHVLLGLDASQPEMSVYVNGRSKTRRITPELCADGTYKAPFLTALIRKFLGRCKVHFSSIYQDVMTLVFFRYVTKTPAVEPQDWLAWKSAIFGKRLVTLGGLFLQAMQHAIKIQKVRRVSYAG